MNARSLRGDIAEPPIGKDPPCVLVVDDDDTIRLVLARVLRKSGFEVYSARSGAEAVEMYTRCGLRIDLVLMDVNMPGMSGPDALAAITAADPLVRCCLMTAGRRAGDAELPECGALAVFSKPFASIQELCDTLHRLVRETESVVRGAAT